MKRPRFGVLVFLLAIASACTHIGSTRSPDAAPAALPATTAPATGAPPALSLVNTMGLLAFAADTGLTTLKGNGLVDSLAMSVMLETVTFPRIFRESGRAYDLVWGPVANAGFNVAAKRFVITNAMYVARERGTSNYVVGIAGTDALSWFDWLIEDADIKPVPWPYATGAGHVANGSLIGLHELQGLRPYAGTKQPGISLADYLSSVAGQPVTIYVAGHSLGGALCEVAGMWLFDTRANWDRGRNATIIPMSFAGPTPGDSGWVAHFDSTFRNSGAVRVWNENDVVPHAWNKRLMNELPRLYPDAPPTDVERVAIDAAIIAADLHDYQQVLRGGTPFKGTLYPNVTRYSEQAIKQHICAYYTYFGVPAPPALKCLIPN